MANPTSWNTPDRRDISVGGALWGGLNYNLINESLLSSPSLVSLSLSSLPRSTGYPGTQNVYPGTRTRTAVSF